MKPRIVYITTAACSANNFFRGQLGCLRRRGLDITVISSPGEELEAVHRREGVATVAVPMEREIRPLRDLVSLWRLFWALRRLRPNLVNAGTPKGGLLGTVAAWLARVPVRIYSIHGLRLETTQGWKRTVLWCSERCASTLATRVICVSHSLRALCLRLGITTEEKATVLGPGSVNGVDVAANPDHTEAAARQSALRVKLGLPGDAKVIGFVGRFTRDKGVPELLEAFNRVAGSHPEARLLMLGSFEEGDPISPDCAKRLVNHAKIVRTGHVPDPVSYYPIMDVFAFPSYREGFPTVLLEAASAGVPVVAFQATGSVDAVKDGVTGLIVPMGDATAMAHAIERYLENPDLRREHGRAARERALREFRHEAIWEWIFMEYQMLLGPTAKVLGAGGESALTESGACDKVM